MLYAGISWGIDGYEIDIVDEAGRPAFAPARFAGGDIDKLVSHLRGVGGELISVVESTNGVIDGSLMNAGLVVYRADPQVLPRPPAFGSVPASTLARIAQRELSALTKLEPRRGSQTGREGELDTGVRETASAVDTLTEMGRCVSHGDRDHPEIALTFDDGPRPPYTGQVLDVLERYGIPATFFCIGLNAGGYREQLVRIREQGHALGNHTWSHPFLPDLSQRQLTQQIARAGETIAEASGGGAPRLFRPPYGSRSPAVMEWLTGVDTTIVLWDVEPYDWAMPGPDAIARVVLEEAKPGSIVLLHDGGGDRRQTVASLPPMIDGLLERGYRFVLVQDLLAAPGRRDGDTSPSSGRERS